MAENTAIEWTDHTFNPWIGCQKIGPACDNCYAETLMDTRMGRVEWGPGKPRVRTSEANWKKPLKWNREAAAFAEANGGRKQRVFCASLADVFDNAVDRRWRADLFDLIDRTPNLDWLLLTKRVGNVRTMLHYENREALPVNVWLGATVVTQEEAERDIPKLLAAPAAMRFLSIEPMLGPVDLTRLLMGSGQGEGEWAGKSIRLNLNALLGASSIGWPPIDWVIAGGESGANARPMHPDWVRSLRDQCASAGVPFLFKQWGEWLPGEFGSPPLVEMQDGSCFDRHALPDMDDAPHWDDGLSFVGEGEGHAIFHRVRKKRAGRLLDGVQHDGFPA